MSWNHRIVKRAEGDKVYYSIHEVYYNDQGVPESISETPIGVMEESKQDVMITLRRMERAITMPTLNYEDF